MYIGVHAMPNRLQCVCGGGGGWVGVGVLHTYVCIYVHACCIPTTCSKGEAAEEAVTDVPHQLM